MANENDLDKRRQILRARGVPEAFVEAVATRKDSLAANIAFLVIPAAGLLAMGFSAPAWLPSFLGWLGGLLYGHARPALLIGASDIAVAGVLGSLMLLVMVSLIAVACLLLLGPARPWPAYSATASAMRQLGRNEKLTSIRRREAYARLSYLSNDQAFLDAVIRMDNAAVYRLPLFVAMAVAAICLLASQSYWRLTDQAFEVRRPWSDRVYPLSSVTAAEVSCGPSGRVSDVFKYELVFPRGRYDIVEAQTTTQPEIGWPEAIARVGRLNQQLVERGVPVRVVAPKGSTSAQFNACLTRWRERRHVQSAFPESLPDTNSGSGTGR